MGRAEELFKRIAEGGESAIDDLIASRASEELFLDFKRSATTLAQRRLADDDRRNLSKALSGFGNSEGGVVVWGVDARDNADVGDVAQAKIRVPNAARFKSWLEGAVSGCTVPPHGGARHAVVAEDANGAGLVATLIPASETAPHQSVVDLRYYIRAGSSFVPAPHGVLAGLFGRVPHPKLTWRVSMPIPQFEDRGGTFFVVVAAVNIGVVPATGIYGYMDVVSGLGRGNSVGFDATHLRDNGAGVSVSRSSIAEGELASSSITDRHFRLPPFGSVGVMSFRIQLRANATRELRFRGLTGAAGAAPVHFEFAASADDVMCTWQEMVGLRERNNITRDDYARLTRKLVGVPAEHFMFGE